MTVSDHFNIVLTKEGNTELVLDKQFNANFFSVSKTKISATATKEESIS
jgi:hypothetical protein